MFWHSSIVIFPSHFSLASLDSFDRFGFPKKIAASGVSNFVLELLYSLGRVRLGSIQNKNNWNNAN